MDKSSASESAFEAAADTLLPSLAGSDGNVDAGGKEGRPDRAEAAQADEEAAGGLGEEAAAGGAVSRVSPQSVLLDIVKRTAGRAPTQEEIETVRNILHVHPYLWRFAGSPERIVAARMLNRSSMSPFAREAARAGLAQLLDELDYKGSHRLVCMAIDQVVLRWLQLAVADHEYQALEESRAKRGELRFAEERVTAAHKRFVRSLDALAKIKRAAKSFSSEALGAKSGAGRRQQVLTQAIRRTLTDNDWSAVFAVADGEGEKAVDSETGAVAFVSKDRPAGSDVSES